MGECAQKQKWRRDGREETGKGGGVTLADGTLGIRLSLKSVSAVFLMCTRL